LLTAAAFTSLNHGVNRGVPSYKPAGSTYKPAMNVYKPPVTSCKPAASAFKPAASTFKPKPQLPVKVPPKYYGRPQVDLSSLPLRHQNWPKVSIKADEGAEEAVIASKDSKTSKELSKPPKDLVNDWNEELDQTSLQTTPNPIKAKSIEVPSRKVLKFNESDVKQSQVPSSASKFMSAILKPNQLAESTDHLVNYITEKQPIRYARLRQLNFVIAVKIEIINVRSVNWFTFTFNRNEMEQLLEEMR
jgi:hypothetical protein